MLKYGMLMPDALQKRQMPNGTAPAAQGDVTATDIAVTEMNDLEYLSPVQVGDTMMSLDFDTGSSDLWVFSNQLPSTQLAGHAVYNTGNNGTGKEMPGSTWKISYGDGSGAEGLVYADKVVIGGATATAQAIEAATSISTEFMTENADGLMGLGFGTFNTIRPQPQPTFFESIKNSLQQPVFAVSLKKNASGTYDFGFIDPNKYTVSINPIIAGGYSKWVARVTSNTFP
jgi:aspergillopepsin I